MAGGAHLPSITSPRTASGNGASSAFALVRGPADGRELGALEIAGAAPIEAEEEILVRPMRSRTDSAIASRTRMSAKIGRRVLKTKAGRSLRQPGRETVLHDPARAHGRNVIAGLPARRIVLRAHVVEAAS